MEKLTSAIEDQETKEAKVMTGFACFTDIPCFFY